MIPVPASCFVAAATLMTRTTAVAQASTKDHEKRSREEPAMAPVTQPSDGMISESPEASTEKTATVAAAAAWAPGSTRPHGAPGSKATLPPTRARETENNWEEGTKEVAAPADAASVEGIETDIAANGSRSPNPEAFEFGTANDEGTIQLHKINQTLFTNKEPVHKMHSSPADRHNAQAETPADGHDLNQNGYGVLLLLAVGLFLLCLLVLFGLVWFGCLGTTDRSETPEHVRMTQHRKKKQRSRGGRQHSDFPANRTHREVTRTHREDPQTHKIDHRNLRPHRQRQLQTT